MKSEELHDRDPLTLVPLHMSLQNGPCMRLACPVVLIDSAVSNDQSETSTERKRKRKKTNNKHVDKEKEENESSILQGAPS